MIDFNRPGRMLSGSKRNIPGHIRVFNANVCVKSVGKIWFGDLDLTTDDSDMRALASERNETIYVLREHHARFANETKPLWALFVAQYHPDGRVVLGQP